MAGFLKLLPSVISFGATAQGAPVLAAMRALPDVLAYRGKLRAPLILGRLIDDGVVSGPWRRLVFGHPAHEGRRGERHAIRTAGLRLPPVARTLLLLRVVGGAFTLHRLRRARPPGRLVPPGSSR